MCILASSPITRRAAIFAFLALACAAVARAEKRVAGLNELVIYGPGLHEKGLPAVEFQQSDVGTTVEIPPTVHVHRYYFDGNKEFQGPLIQGGPTIVVANHPVSGTKMYAEVNLPAGAPVIVHNRHCITYVYNERRVVIEFSCTRVGDDHVTVKMLPGRGILRNLRDQARQNKDQNVRQFGTTCKKGKLCQAVCDVGTSTIKTVKGGVGVVTQTAASAIDGGRKVIEALPPVNLLQSAVDQQQPTAIQAPTNSKAYSQTKFPTTDFPTIR